MKYTEAYNKPLAELLYSEPAELICDSFVGGDPEGFVNEGDEEW